MTIREIVENVIFETYNEFENRNKTGNNQCVGAIIEYIRKNDEQYFSYGNARNDLKQYVTQRRMTMEMARKYVERVSKEPEINTIRPLRHAVKATYDALFSEFHNHEYAIKNTMDALIEYIESGDNNFPCDVISKEALNQHYKYENALREVISTAVQTIVIEHQQSVSKYTVDNLQIYPETIRECKPQILSGKTDFAYVHDSRILSSETGQKGELAASSSIGLKRKGQEDAALIIVHPKNPDFKLLVVADGIGGYEQGEEASNLAVTYIKEWFEREESLEYFDDTEQIWANDMQQQIQFINNTILQRFKEAGTTFVAAMVGKEKTMLANIGDSRAYTISGRSVRQVTEDHSLCYRMYKNGEIVQKDDIRFHINSHKILRSLGISETARPDYYEIDNRSYDILLLTSDGVTDCISDPRLMKIAIEGRTSKEIAQTIVGAALDKNNPDLIARSGVFDDKDYVEEISPGKDNTTAVVYKKDKGAER